ncbi:MAG: hypothetical protein ABL936_01465 [Aestuariivirga sp.]
MEKKLICLIDLAHTSKLGLSSDTMPLQLGLIGAYCLKDSKDQVDVELFKFIEEFDSVVAQREPFIVGVSNYIWNIDIGYNAIKVLRKRYPNAIIVCGGPNYPDEFEDQVEFLKQYPLFDICIYKDGEIPFATLVKFLLENGGNIEAAKRAKLPSCHALVDGEPLFGETVPRVRDLSSLPSPYLAGLMDKFFDQKLIPTIQTNRGCPFTCTFCTEGGSYYNKVFKTTLDRKTAEVKYIVDRVKHTKSLRITDSNFGMFEEDQDFCRFLGEQQALTGYPEYIMCSTGKNKKERVLACNELLNGAMRLTASVQSLDPSVLSAVKRDNISIEALMYVSDETSDSDTHAYSELILALPNDSVTAHEASIDGLMKIGIGNITQHQLALIHGTELNSRETRRKYNYRSGFRPIQRSIGRYSLLGEEFFSVEIEEIAVATNTLSIDDYFAMRRLYLAVGIFYNDRIFGDVHALLRIMKLSTFDWIKLIQKNFDQLPKEIQALFDDFIADTGDELWDHPAELVRDVSSNIDAYTAGEVGGNLIYKYRSKAVVEHFRILLKTAFKYLREYLASVDMLDSAALAVDELEKFSRQQKVELFNIDTEYVETFSYDILKLIQDPAFARSGGTLEELRYPTTLKVTHNEGQRATITRELAFYGSDIGGLTMLISRYPIKRFWRKATYADSFVPLPAVVEQENVANA